MEKLQNCLELMRKTRENKVTTTELVRRRKILERQQDHLMLIKRRSKIGTSSEGAGTKKWWNIFVRRWLSWEDVHWSEVTFPTVMTVVIKETSLMITVKDVKGNIVNNWSSKIEAFATTKISVKKAY